MYLTFSESKSIDVMNVGKSKHGEPCLIAAFLNVCTSTFTVFIIYFCTNCFFTQLPNLINDISFTFIHNYGNNTECIVHF